MSRSLLSSLSSVEELKLFSAEKLEQLAKEIRQHIIDVVAKTGGHLASNLGSVEFTLALHAVFSSPEDQFIFDVSHQTYTHKLLTGRQELFQRLRKYKGLCGFTDPTESDHDHFYAGHAGTALSLALGLAKSRDLAQQSHHIIPVIGDATLTCGLTLEALNNISSDLSRFIIILNDNEMSISQNVGGVTNILSRLVSHPKIDKVTQTLAKLPLGGKGLAKMGSRVQHFLKECVSPASFFEQFGLSYTGPIDGHDISKLIALFKQVKQNPRPLLLHLYTQKGHGLERAENDPITFHGAKPFDKTTCEFLPSQAKGPTFPKVFGKELVKMGEKDPSIVAVTPAMSLGSSLTAFANAFPDRFFDVGIAEGHAVTFSGGLAKGVKLKVFCSIYATFLQRALDNLFHDVCLQKLPVVFAIDRAGLSAADGPTHHGVFEIGFLKTMPNMVICQPRDGQVLKELLDVAFSWEKPTAIRYPNLPTSQTEDPLKERPLGKGEILSKGEDLLIIPLGVMCEEGLKLKQKLLDYGVNATVFDPVFIKPLDTATLSKLMLSHKKVITLEEHSLKGGLASEINHFLTTYGFTATVLNFGIPEAFIEHGDRPTLLDGAGLSVEKMLQKTLVHFNIPQPSLSI